MVRRLNDPVGGFRFLVELGALQVAGFSECTGLQLEAKTYEYREGGRNSHTLRFPDVGAVGNVVLKRGVIGGPGLDPLANTLFQWQLEVLSGAFQQAPGRNHRPGDVAEDVDRRLAIVLLDEQGVPVRRWRLRRAFPVKWTGPELKAGASEVAVESLELTCEGIEVG